MDAGAVGGGGNIQGKGAWVDLWRSDDEGESFELVSTPVEVSRSGNPPTLTLLPDVSFSGLRVAHLIDRWRYFDGGCGVVTGTAGAGGGLEAAAVRNSREDLGAIWLGSCWCV